MLYRGELPRGDAAGVVGAGERHARRIVSALVERGVRSPPTARAPHYALSFRPRLRRVGCRDCFLRRWQIDNAQRNRPGLAKPAPQQTLQPLPGTYRRDSLVSGVINEVISISAPILLNHLEPEFHGQICSFCIVNKGA